MNYLKSFVKGNEDAAPTGAEMVSRLCDRVSSSTLLDDRRDAVRALKAFSKKYPLDVGTQALPHLIEVLKSDSTDEEITAYALETLFNLSTMDSDDEDAVVQPEIAAAFIERFLEVTENVFIAVGMIERYELSIRLAAIRLLAALLRGKSNEVQQIVLVMPMGISRIMDLLADSREVIRNDALLALIEVTRGNPNIQKIVAFENGFESIFNIIEGEDLSDGGVVVEDCLMLLLHLLKNNTSNQQFFKEGSLIHRITPFFEIDHEATWTAQKCANIHLMLKVIRTLVAPSNPSNVTSSCQLAMQHCQLLQKLSDSLMATGVPTDVLTETINTVSELVRGCNDNQRYFASVMAPWDPPRPALVVLLMSMVNGQQPFTLRCAVLYCFQCFLHKNPEGQTQIINTLLPSSLDVAAQDISTGQLLCGGLFAASDPLSNWLAATALSHALKLNEDAKLNLLKVQLATASGNAPISFLRQITNIVQQTASLQTRVGLLSLLCGWLTDCPPVVAYFLENKSAVTFLLSQVAEDGTELEFVLHGVCALLLGICIIDNDDSVPQYTKESLIELIAARVGIDRFCDALSCVNQHDLYTKALQRPQPTAEKPDYLLFNHSFAKLFKSQEDTIIKTVSNLEDVKKEEEQKAAMKAHDSIVNEYKEIIRKQDAEVTQLKEKCNKLEAEFTSSSNLLTERDSQVQQLKDQYNVLKLTQGSTNDESLSMMTERMEALSQQLAQKETELSSHQQTILGLQAQLDTKSTGDASQCNALQPEVKDLQEQIERLTLSVNEKDAQLAKEQNLKASANQTDAASDALVAEKAAMRSEISEMQEKLKKAEEEILKLKEQNAFLTENCSISEKKVKQLEEIQTSLSKQLEESKSNSDAMKTEQDDLLVLLTDQEEKLANYKTQLRSFGAEVSSDEDNDEGSDTKLEEEDSAVSEKENGLHIEDET